jgi:hypothetical protein
LDNFLGEDDFWLAYASGITDLQASISEHEETQTTQSLVYRILGPSVHVEYIVWQYALSKWGVLE